MDSELNDLRANFVEVQREAIRRTQEAVDIINQKLSIRLPYPQVRFSIKGGVAGRAHCGRDLIEYNPTLLGENVEDFLRQTVRHEVAHLAAHKKFGGGIKPHGKEWCSCCWYLSIPAVRCHSYDLDNVPTRALNQRRTSPVQRTESGIVVHTGNARITRFED
jgi:predicted SprT family Zn-dependent metalloprotease